MLGADVAVIGSGPAGMAAAISLVRAGVQVVLLERERVIGGRPRAYGCKAAPACTGCGLCAYSDLLTAVEEARAEGEAGGGLKVLVSTSVTSATRVGVAGDAAGGSATIEAAGRVGEGAKRGRWRLGLESVPGQVAVPSHGAAGSDSVVEARAVVCATGAVPFPLEQRPAYLPTRPGAGLLSSADMETVLQQGELERYLPVERPRVAFVQCVGSRNVVRGAGYCSRICCANALRMARRVTFENPGAEVTIFYIDLQLPERARNGKLREALSHPAISLWRGLPSEIRPVGARFLVRAERVDEGGVGEEEFDLIVFSVGMAPDTGNRSLLSALGLGVDEHGFAHAEAPTGVFVAGTCGSPMEVREAIADGAAAAVRALEVLGKSLRLPPVTVLGDRADGPGSRAIEVLANLGFSGPSLSTRLETVHEDMLVGPTGLVAPAAPAAPIEAGCLLLAPSLLPQDDGGKRGHAADAVRESARAVGARCLGLAELASAGCRPAPAPGGSGPTGSLCLLLDVEGFDPLPVHRQALELATAWRAGDPNMAVAVVAREMRVSGAGMEEMYLAARLAGVAFFRHAGDLSLARIEGRPRLLVEEPLGPAGRKMVVQVPADTVVLASPLRPAPWFGRAAAALRIAAADGSAPEDSPRFYGPITPLRGVYVLGSGRGAEVDSEVRRDALVAVADMLAWEGRRQKPLVEVVAARTGACASCLTCLRWCPHGVISLSTGKAVVDDNRCQGCGICLAVCPARALRWSAERWPRPVSGNLSGGYGLEANEKKSPIADAPLAVFCCSRSAWRALGGVAGAQAGWDLHEVPCAGSVDEGIILSALAAGARGVLILGCPEGACGHMVGHRAVQGAVERVQSLLSGAGLDPELVRFHGVGPLDLGIRKGREAVWA